ncbi:MAG: IPT/TIG domain-containing protein [Planctomycetes bacterium]|nr:IPT/TIG domain-containing protein [Planctomycetota bacterium]
MKTGSLLCLMIAVALLCASLAAQSTSGTLSTSDDSFTHPGAPMVGSAGGPRRYRAIEFNVVTTGNYTFTYTPSGYTGALYLYQGIYLPSSPIANIWTFGDTGSPVVVVHNLSVTGKFVVVLTSTTNNASGSWTLGISGPGTLEMGAVVNSCSPTSGSTGGGTNVTLSGSFFTGVNSVTFGGSSVTNLTVVNDTTITCTTPAHAAGAVTIRANKPGGFGLAGERFNAYTYNLTPTSVSSINRQTPAGGTTNSSSVVFRVTFAASVGGVNTGNFSITKTGGIVGESVSGVSGSGTLWDVTVNTGSGDGTIRLDMVNDTSMTPTLTNLPFTGGQMYTIDKTAPTVSSINRAGADPTNAASVSFTVTFSESVSGVTTGNFALDTTGVSGASITGVSGTGTTRTVTVNTGSGDGTVSIDLLTVTGILDTAGNALGSAFVAGQAYTIDKTAPGISISTPNPTSTISGPVDFTITYTGASSVTLATGNVTLNTTGSATGSVSVTGSGTGSRTVTISGISGTGTIGISIAAGTAGDAAGNSAAAAGPSATCTVTAIPALTSIVRVGGSLTNAASVSWTVTFGAAVTGVNTGNFSTTVTGLSGTSVTGVSGSGTTWTVTASTGTGDGTIRLDMVNATSVSPGVSNLPYTTGESYTVDKTAPSITGITRASGNPTNAATVTFNVAVSESVSGVTPAAFALDATGVSGASITGISGSGASYSVTVNTGSGNGTVSVDLTTIAGIIDAAGNALAAAFTAGEAYTVDKAAPSVSSITRVAANPTNAASVDFTVTFSESVTGVVISSFAMNTTGVTGASVTGVSGTGATRTVTVNTGSGDGTVEVELASVSGIVDAAGNLLAGTFTSGESYTVDKTAPSVVGITRVGSSPTNAASVDFTVTFSESVSGVTPGKFSLDTTGVTGASITGVSGSGTTYTVSVNTGSGDGTVSIDLTTVTGVTDAAGNTLSGTFTAGETYAIDKTNPGIAIGAPSPGSTTAGPVDFTVTYTGATGVSLAVGDVSLNTTGTASGAVSVSGSGTSTRTVTISGITGNGTIGISIAAGTASDGAGNLAGAAGPSTTATVTNVPGVSIGAPSVSVTQGGPVDFVITYSGATAVTLAAGDVSLNATGTAAGSVAVSGTGTTTRTVTVSGITGDGSFTISIAGGTASNPGGGAPAAGPSAAVEVDNTVPVLTPGGTVTVSQGTTNVGAVVGTVSDNLTAIGSLNVSASSVPTGLAVSNVSNIGGNVTADIQALGAATPGIHQVEFTVTDAAGNSGTANLNVDVLANQPPTISAVTDQTISMNANTGALAITVGDTEDAPGALVLTATCDNQILLDPLTDFVFGGSGAARTLTITPQSNNVGVATVTLTVTDTLSAATSTSFMLIVTDTTDAPSISLIPDSVITRDQTSPAINFVVDDPQGVGTLGAPAADSLNTALIQAGDFTFGGTAPSLNFTITPQAGMTGAAVCIVYISDGTYTASRAFTVTVQDPVATSGGNDEDDEKCSTGGAGGSWLLLLALLAGVTVGARQFRRA